MKITVKNAKFEKKISGNSGICCSSLHECQIEMKNCWDKLRMKAEREPDTPYQTGLSLSFHSQLVSAIFHFNLAFMEWRTTNARVTRYFFFEFGVFDSKMTNFLYTLPTLPRTFRYENFWSRLRRGGAKSQTKLNLSLVI